MKYLGIMTLLLVMYNQVSYAETLHFNGYISEFTCSSHDNNEQCKNLYQFVSDAYAKDRSIADFNSLIEQQNNELFSISIEPLDNKSKAVILADYI